MENAANVDTPYGAHDPYPSEELNWLIHISCFYSMLLKIGIYPENKDATWFFEVAWMFC